MAISSLNNAAAFGMLQNTLANLASNNSGTALDISALSLLNGGNNGASPLPATELYKYYDKNGASLLKKSNDSKQVKDAIDYFTTAIQKVTSVDQIFKDQKLYNFITTALGLGDTAESQKGLIKKALTGYVIPPDKVAALKQQGLLNSNGRPVDSAARDKLVEAGFLDPTNPTRIGVANQLTNPVYANAAATLNFANTGVKTIKSQATIDQLVRQYQSISFENKINTQSAAVAEARYALAKLPPLADKTNSANNNGTVPAPSTPADALNNNTINNSSPIYKLLSDATLRDFVATAFNIPQRVAVQPIQTQAKIFASKIDMTQLNNPTYVNKLIKTYLTQSDNSTANISANSAQSTLNLFGR